VNRLIPSAMLRARQTTGSARVQVLVPFDFGPYSSMLTYLGLSLLISQLLASCFTCIHSVSV